MINLTYEKFADFSLYAGQPKKSVYSIENQTLNSPADSQDAEVQNPGTSHPNTIFQSCELEVEPWVMLKLEVVPWVMLILYSEI